MSIGRDFEESDFEKSLAGVFVQHAGKFFGCSAIAYEVGIRDSAPIEGAHENDDTISDGDEALDRYGFGRRGQTAGRDRAFDIPGGPLGEIFEYREIQSDFIAEHGQDLIFLDAGEERGRRKLKTKWTAASNAWAVGAFGDGIIGFQASRFNPCRRVLRS
jgi:hypothetical protein